MAPVTDDNMAARKESVDSDVKVVETRQVEGVNIDMAQIMDGPDKPNPWGPGYIKLYLLVGLLFMNSTMNGTWLDTSDLATLTASRL